MSGIDTHAIAVAQEQVSNWLRTGCSATDCLATLRVSDDVLEGQRTWDVVFLAIYQVASAALYPTTVSVAA